MSKGNRGNKEAKKPKKVQPPAPPAGAPTVAVALSAPAPERHKKR